LKIAVPSNKNIEKPADCIWNGQGNIIIFLSSFSSSAKRQFIFKVIFKLSVKHGLRTGIAAKHKDLKDT